MTNQAALQQEALLAKSFIRDELSFLLHSVNGSDRNSRRHFRTIRQAAAPSICSSRIAIGRRHIVSPRDILISVWTRAPRYDMR